MILCPEVSFQLYLHAPDPALRSSRNQTVLEDAEACAHTVIRSRWPSQRRSRVAFVRVSWRRRANVESGFLRRRLSLHQFCSAHAMIVLVIDSKWFWNSASGLASAELF